MKAQVAFVLLGAAFELLAGCGGGGSNPPAPPMPQIQNINSATVPTTPANMPIEINGSGFQTAPGKVTFTQENLSVDVAPAAAAWTDTGIVATLPAGDGITDFSVPGNVKVAVTTSNGTSNSVALSLAPPPNFTPSRMAWSTTVPFPVLLTGLRAVGVRGSSTTSAFAVVTGGFNGFGNTSTAWSIVLNQDGSVGSRADPQWTSTPTEPLPTPTAHHAMAIADDNNSLARLGQRYIYVIGGQMNSADLAGSNHVYVAPVNSATGQVGAWTALNTLPQALYGLTATVYNGYLYVAGGIGMNGAPVSSVYSARVFSNGTLGMWTRAANALPSPTAFGTMFVFGGTIYYIGGQVIAGVAPNDQVIGVTRVYYASAIRGEIGKWTQNGNSTIVGRAKGVVFNAHGQVISGEGVYAGAVSSVEMESSTIDASATALDELTAFTRLPGVPNANVYNAAGLTSPMMTFANAPRFLMLGGQKVKGTSGAGGELSSTVYYNTSP